MSNEEIKEGNRILSEFEGMEFINDDIETYPNGYYVMDDSENGHAFAFSENLKYNTSFDWLMPLCRKFKYLFDIENMSEKNYIDYNNICDSLDEVVFTTYSEFPTFIKLVEAVKWYNSIN
jgi:hypothetical protein